MSSGEHKRQSQISEPDPQTDQQAKSQNKGKETCELSIKRDLGQDSSNSKRGRKKVKTRPVKDLGHMVEHQVQKDGTCSKEDRHENAENQAVDMSSRAGLPEKSKLEFLLGVLQRRDLHQIFAEPVNPDEVEHYYDVIKEPMDFGTIATKLNGGSYQTLQDFEHDVYLVSSNAMVFNASNTIYYRQARAIKELSQKLFHALKTDPVNFETEFSVRKRGLGRRSKAEGGLINSNSCNKVTSTETALKGCRGKGKSEYLEVDRRWTYRPWTSNENESTVSMVYNDSKALKQDKKATVGVGYIGSLMQFAKDLGPTAQMVARRKADRCITEALKIANANSNYALQTPENQIPAAGLSCQKGITTTPSLKIPENSVGSRNFLGGFLGIQSGSLNGDKASSVDTMNTLDALNRGISQANRRQTLHDATGKEFPSGGINWASSKNKASRDTKGKNILGGGINGASNVTETLGDFQPKRLQAKSEWLGVNNTFKGVTTDQNTIIQSGSSAYGDGNFDFLAGWNIDSSPNKLSFSKMMQDALNMEDPVPKAEITPSELRMQPSVPPEYIGASSFSWQWPSRGMIDGSSRSQTISTMNLLDSYYSGNGAHRNQTLTDRGGPNYRGNLEQGDQFLNWFKPAEVGPKLYADGWLPRKSRSAGMNASFPAGPSKQQSWVSNPSSGRGLYRIHGLADGGGPSYKGNLEQGGQVSNWFKLAQLGLQPVGDGCFQNHSKLFEMDSSGQAGTSRQQQQQHGWTITPSNGHVMNTLNACEFEMCQTPRQGELSIGAPPDNHQKQPVSDIDSLLEWLGNK